MARSHGKLLASIWSDPDFLALDTDAQWVYMMLLSQPKLALTGVLDYMPARWSRNTSDMTAERIENAVGTLEAARFVLVDRDTDELLIRTLVRHDISLSRLNSNLIKGLWSAWKAIASEVLKGEVVRQVPDAIWCHVTATPPADAVPFRSAIATSGSNYRFQPDDDPSGSPIQTEDTATEPHPPPEKAQVTTIETASSDQRSEPLNGTVNPNPLSPITTHLSPVSGHLSPITGPARTPTGSLPKYGFEWFWSEYPRHAKKPDAEKAWRSVTGNGAADIDIVNGVRRWVTFWQASDTEEQFIPHPATFLRNRQFADQPPRPPRTTSDRKRDEAVDVITSFISEDEGATA